MEKSLPLFPPDEVRSKDLDELARRIDEHLDTSFLDEVTRALGTPKPPEDDSAAA
jgi:hypothetical protein